MVEEATEHAQRVALEARERKDLAALDTPVVELPLLPDAGDLGGLYRLAEIMLAQGMVG